MKALRRKKSVWRHKVLKWLAVLVYLCGTYYLGVIAFNDALSRNRLGNGGYSEKSDGIGQLVLQESGLSAREVWRTNKDHEGEYESYEIWVFIGEADETMFQTVFNDNAYINLSIGKSGRLAYYTNRNGYVDLVLKSVVDEGGGYRYFDFDSDGDLDLMCEHTGSVYPSVGKLRRGNKWIEAIFDDVRREWIALDELEEGPTH